MQAVEEALRHCLKRGLTFVLFRWQGQLHLWVQDRPGLEHRALKDLARTSERFVIAPFKTGMEGAFVLRPDVRMTLTDTAFDPGYLKDRVGGEALAGTCGPSWDRAEHQAAVAEAKHAFAKGTLRKVVLSRTMNAPFPSNSLPQLFTEALATYPNAFVCLMNCPVQGTWLGASPERLLVCRNKVVTVDSIAGTMPADQAPEHAQEWGHKERDEQDLVSRALEEVFAAHGLEDMERHGPHVFAAGPVSHLSTTYTASLGKAVLATLVKALHPTPAVCGTPRDPALRFILRTEPEDRKLYAGYWGPWQVGGNTELYVNIRCLQAFVDSVSIHVGGGITAGSTAQDEWQEMEYKASTWTGLMQAVTGRIS